MRKDLNEDLSRAGNQSTRHMTNLSHGQLVTVISSHDQLITRSCRHIVLVNSSYGQLVPGNSPQADTHTRSN